MGARAALEEQAQNLLAEITAELSPPTDDEARRTGLERDVLPVVRADGFGVGRNERWIGADPSAHVDDTHLGVAPFPREFGAARECRVELEFIRYARIRKNPKADAAWTLFGSGDGAAQQVTVPSAWRENARVACDFTHQGKLVQVAISLQSD